MVWSPSKEVVERAQMTRFMGSLGFSDYGALWRWSVDDLPGFWRSIWDHFRVLAAGDPSRVLASETMPRATWFPDVSLSYAEHIFRERPDDGIAIR
jgi:acetoacetyl-CoA synthetase